MSPRTILRDRRGIALLTTLLVAFAVSAIALGACMMTLNAKLLARNSERLAMVDAASHAGLEEARSRVTGNRAVYPTSGYTTLESNVAVRDASGNTIPSVTRSTWIGPVGITTGQFGVTGAIISHARDAFGNQAVRRLEINQESFSKFAYFTDIEEDTAGTTLSFLNGDAIWGPVHSNDTIRIASTGATFYNQVTSRRPTIIGQANGTFLLAPKLNQPRIPMPTVADLNMLDSLATVGSSRFTGSTAGATGEARTRIEFITLDIGGGTMEGFFRVYQGTNEDFVSASLPANPYLRASRNCGDLDSLAGVPRFLPAALHTNLSLPPHNHSVASTAVNQDSSLTSAARRCYLGGDSILTSTALGTSAGANWPTTGHFDGGTWVQAPAGINAAIAAVPALSGRPDRDFLFPLNRARNVNFKGVIYVAGKVIVSGVIHGRVTLAASGNIIFGDDLTYYENPATRDCTLGDIAGFFSGQSLIVANNTINSPQTTNTNMSISGTSTSNTGVRTYDDTSAETIHGFMLTLRTFGAENYNVGNMVAQACTTGGVSSVGRGCLNTYGGIIQGWRGAVTTTSGGNGTGYAKRYQYDACGATDPPPYYPTTGVFVRNRFYEMDPVRFNVAAWYAANQN
ncbi:MAG: hypothetical protein JNM53_12760 [Gemmatimonadetes bacterium]|nr:hypothetical protein [Gemmatimonadota bacterium]